MTELMIAESSTLMVAQNSSSIECDRFGDKLLMVPKPEQQTWIPILLDKKDGDYIITVSPEENKIKSLLEKAAKDEDEISTIQVPEELMDQLTAKDEMAVFKFAEIMEQFSSSIKKKIFNPVSLANLLIRLSEVFDIEYVFVVVGAMSDEEMECILLSKNPVGIFNRIVEEEEE